jgi:hypothetical protein
MGSIVTIRVEFIGATHPAGITMGGRLTSGDSSIIEHPDAAIN